MTVKELREELAKYPDDMLVTYFTEWEDEEVHGFDIRDAESWSNPFGQKTLRIQ